MKDGKSKGNNYLRPRIAMKLSFLSKFHIKKLLKTKAL